MELDGVGALHAAFLNESSTRGNVQRCVAGNPGPVEMTILFEHGIYAFPGESVELICSSADLSWKRARVVESFRSKFGLLVSLRDRMRRLRFTLWQRPREQHASAAGQQVLPPVELICNRRTPDLRTRPGMP